MRIAQVSPLYESVPPALYGGTERVVSYLTEELLELGHDVTLFASGDSRSRARIIAPCARALRLAGCADPLPAHVTMLEQVYRRRAEFDVVHFHVDCLHFGATRRTPNLVHASTLHGRLDAPDLVPLYDEFSELPVISISSAQRAVLPHANWIGTVLHGLPVELYRAGPGGDYLAFVGRISPEKGLAGAVAIAERAGMRLRVAAKVAREERDYFTEVVAPLFAKNPHVEFLGEVGERDKQELLANARALLFPIEWPEPFGIVMIEAMACGTPVIAYPRGSVPEVVDEGVTGFVVDSLEAAVAATDRAARLSRSAVRARFEQRFSAERMARDYVELYDLLMAHDARDRARQSGLLHPGNKHASG